MIKLKIIVERDGVTFEENRVLDDEDDFREEYDCDIIRDLVYELEN